MLKLVIGIVGPIGAGKDTVADYLVQNYGFVKFNTSDEIRAEWRRRGKLEFSREDMRTLSTELRNQYQPEQRDILIERTLQKIHDQKCEKALMLGMRLVDGVDYLRRQLGQNFFLLAINAGQKLRYERKHASSRSDDRDLQTFEDFKQRDDLELSGEIGNAQEVAKVMNMADLVMVNDQGKEDLARRLDEVMLRFASRLQ